MGYFEGKLVYELRVPLVQDEKHPHAIGMDVSEPIGIGFETAELDREQIREKMGGGMPSGGRGMPGGGEKGGGGKSGGRGSRGGEAPRRLELWTKVELASGNAFAAE
jgi:uncharacterized membrane protein YgcG